MEEDSAMTVGAVVFNIIAQILLTSISVFITYRSFQNGINWFAWHPSLMTISVLILFSNGILTMSGNNLFTIKFSRKVRRSIHAILQQIAAFLIVIALISIVMHKIQNSSPHFVTAHSLLGLSTIVFVFIAMIGGGFARINFQLREYVRPIITKSLHALLGMITFTLGVITLCFGITSQWFADHSGLALQRTLVGFVTFTSIYVVYKSVVNWVDRVERAMQRS